MDETIIFEIRAGKGSGEVIAETEDRKQAYEWAQMYREDSPDEKIWVSSRRET